MIKLPISVIILTYNEEKNIEECLKSVYGWVEEIFIVDSYSTDKTLEIARKYTDKIYLHPFENYSKQRNWTLKNLPIKTEWILNLDSDHRVTFELSNELKDIFSKHISNKINGFMISRRTIFMGKWIKYGGHYPVYHNVLFRKGKGFCENRLYEQHFVVDGTSLKLKGDIIDIISDSLDKFCFRHLKWATAEAVEQLIGSGGEIKADVLGNPIQRRRSLRNFFNASLNFYALFFISFIAIFSGLVFWTATKG
jgi:glycosyltransferase involved in cell wall biosynthesis